MPVVMHISLHKTFLNCWMNIIFKKNCLLSFHSQQSIIQLLCAILYALRLAHMQSHVLHFRPDDGNCEKKEGVSLFSLLFVLLLLLPSWK